MTETKAWEGDLLGRQSEGDYLRNYIERLYSLNKKDQTSFVLNINSEWGQGKTWFLKNLAMDLKQNRPVVYFDAWRNDFSEDALLSFVSVVCQELSRQYEDNQKISSSVGALKASFTSWVKKAIPIVAEVAVKKITGSTIDEINENVESIDWDSEEASQIAGQLTKIASKCAVEEFTKKKESIELFEIAVQHLVDSVDHLPICIFIDELDRCRPTYAIELLESIKHLFSVKGIFFILATDTVQLGHSIKAIYGEGFNSHAYLKRFFYAEYNLNKPNYVQISNFLFDNSPNIREFIFLPSALGGAESIPLYFSYISRFFKLPTRDQLHVFQILENIVLGSDKRDIHFLLIMFLICLKYKHADEYSQLVVIRNSDLFTRYIGTEARTRFDNFNLSGGYRDTNGHSTESNFSMGSLFEYYLGLLDGSLENKNLKETVGFEWQINISRALIGPVPKNWRTGKYDGTHDLGTYFQLLDQSGRLVANP